MNYFNKKKRQFDFRNPKILSTTSRDKTVVFKSVYLWIVFFVAIIGLIYWWLFYSDFFKIKNIEISGTLNEGIRNEIDGFKGKNILLFTIGQKDKELAKKQTSVEKLNIIKGIPDTLKVEVLVRKPTVKWKTKDKEYFIDFNGIIFGLDNPSDEDKNKPMVIDAKNIDVQVGSKLVTDDFVEFVVKLNNDLPIKTKKQINEIRVNDTTLDVEIKLKDSYSVYYSSIDNFDDQMYLLSKVIEAHDGQIKDYIDLRVKNRAYYK